MKGSTSGLACEVNPESCFLGNHKVKIDLECCVHTTPLICEALHLDWKSRLLLCVQETYALQTNVGCFILTTVIPSSKFLIVSNCKEQSFSLNENSGVHLKGVITLQWRVFGRNTVLS